MKDAQWLVEQNSQLDFCNSDSDCTMLDSYARTPTTVDEYFELLDAWLTALELPVNPNTGRPYLGEGSSDDGENGDNGFSVDYYLSSTWQSEEIEEGVCDGSIIVTSAMGVDVKIFDGSINLVEVGLTLRSKGTKHRLSLGVIMAGETVYGAEPGQLGDEEDEGEVELDAYYTKVSNPYEDFKLLEYSQAMVVAGQSHVNYALPFFES